VSPSGAVSQLHIVSYLTDIWIQRGETIASPPPDPEVAGPNAVDVRGGYPNDNRGLAMPSCLMAGQDPRQAAKNGNENIQPPVLTHCSGGGGKVAMPSAYIAPILLLVCSNVFMTFAWYGQLRYPNVSLWLVVLVSWAIAFFEYCLAVPANRIGHQVYSTAQLKTMQEIITLLVFAVFSVSWLGEPLRWNHGVAFAFLCGAAFFSFHNWN
jgi:uncharacterized protein